MVTNVAAPHSDGFLELARLIWSASQGASANGQSKDTNAPSHSSLIDWLSKLLARANSGIGGIYLGNDLTPELRSAFRTHPELFVLENNLLQLPRYARHRENIRSFFANRLVSQSSCFDSLKVASALDQIFPFEQKFAPDNSTIIFENTQQRLAIAALVDTKIGIITGGPGTGKTTTAAALLSLYKRLRPELNPRSVLVTAPTGKAACRIGEAIRKAAAHLHGLSEEERQFLFSIRTTTLHKALEWSPIPPELGGPFQRTKQRPLEAQIVLVDEASMVDLSLMYALVEALGDDTSLVLLGDSDQLESVEAGGMLAEFVHRSSTVSLPQNLLEKLALRLQSPEDTIHSIFQTGLPALTELSYASLPGLTFGLKFSRRAMNAPWILELAELFRPTASCQLVQIEALFQNTESNKLSWHSEHPHKSRKSICREQWRLWAELSSSWIELTSESSPEALQIPIQELGRFQLLCSTNAQVDQANEEGIAILAGSRAFPNAALPHGCPILIEANDHLLGLSNGDIGIIIGDKKNEPGLLALFALGNSQTVLVPVAQLPAHRPAFALTIHKSQGSEWEHVAIEMPSEQTAALLSRNLLYTAITRSSQRLDLFGTKAAVNELIKSGNKGLM